MTRKTSARIAELEALILAAEISEANGATPQKDDDGRTIVDTATCGTCGKSWNDALISSVTPAPSARCPYEPLHMEIAELAALKARHMTAPTLPQIREALEEAQSALGMANDCVAYCRRSHRDAQNGTGFPVEIAFREALAKVRAVLERMGS